MTEHHEEWQKHVKKGPFGDEPFTEEHKQKVIQTVQRISQNPASKKQRFRLKHIFVTITACGAVLTAAWMLLSSNGLKPNDAATISMAETSMPTESFEDAVNNLPFSMDQRGLEKSTKNEDDLYSSSENETYKTSISDQNLWMKDLINEADLIADLNITETHEIKATDGSDKGISIQAQVNEIVVSSEKEIPSDLKIDMSETLNHADISLTKEDRVILFMSKAEQPGTYNLVGQTKGIYVVSEDDLVSSIDSELDPPSAEEVPYSEFTHNIKALADN
ncbi:hypothetical protein [Paenibacillus sp. Marseille-Q4541]|uniref:hypothetical protein n=1 Tax=Paenibacillus sp. Marseille-Q4541 TaxID=2831522 RepID=UPI001BACA6A6|nr:hypothetical protein [Paenibacillus sp. Marseille-Q4541]